MTDEAIFELTPETSMTAAARFIVQEVAETTRATSATYALMGGLELNTTYDTAADHSNITAEVGKMYAVDISAVTTDNLQLVLPDTAKLGERVGVVITAEDASDDYELEIRTAATGSLLNGVDCSASSTKWRVFLQWETLTLRCINAGGAGDTDWIVENDGRIPCVYGGRHASVSLTGTSTVNFDLSAMGVRVNYGFKIDTTNDDVLPRRSGAVLMNCHAESDWGFSGYLKMTLWVGGTTSTSQMVVNVTNEPTFLSASILDNVSPGTTVYATIVSENTDTISTTSMDIIEVLTK